MMLTTRIANPRHHDWLGEIPSHWDVLPLFACFEERDTPNVGGAVSRVLSLSYGQIVDRDVESNEGLLPESFDSYNIVEPGDIVLRLTDLQNDQRSLRTGQVRDRGIITSAYVTIGPRRKLDERFAAYLLHGYDLLKVFYAMGGGVRQSLKFADLKHLPICVPPEAEQRAISTYLDRETAEIDSLIEKQERLIALLEEKRQAAISHAITKGLDPNAPMKDSGIPWLGAIPAHWQVRTLGSVSVKITNGYVGPTRDILVPQGTRYLQSLHIKLNRISFSPEYFVTEEWSMAHSKSILRRGDVLIVQTGDIGQSAVVPPDFEGCNCHALIIVTPQSETLDGFFLSWVLNSSYGVNKLLSIQTGALHPHLNCGNVKFIELPIPPLAEQIALRDHVEALDKQMTNTVSQVRRSIDLARERRTALISAAVTGKIDVAGRV